MFDVKKVDIPSKSVKEMEDDFRYSQYDIESGNILLYDEPVYNHPEVDFDTYGCIYPVHGKNMWMFWKELSLKTTGDVIRIAWKMPKEEEEYLKELIRAQDFEDLEE